jgi:hypothetical protein
MQCPKCHYIRTEKDTNPDWQCPSCLIAYQKFKANGRRLLSEYVPNFIPEGVRTFNFFASVFLLLYGAYGIVVNDLYLRGKRGRGIHLHDGSASIMYMAFLCACVVMISVIMDHHDKRNNEHAYQSISRVFKIAGWGLFAASLIYAVIHHQIS